jgi:hypothetical protein
MADRPYLGLLRALDAAGVAYAVAGGLAVVLHGVPRMTFDLDIVVDDSDDNMTRLCETLTREGFRPRLPVPLSDLANASIRHDWVTSRNLVAFTLHHPERTMEEVDVVLVTSAPWSEIARTLVERRIDDVRVPVVGRAMLRQMKLATGRDKDLADAELLGEFDE